MDISNNYSKIIYSRLIGKELLTCIQQYGTGNVFLVTEETVNKLWITKFDDFFESNKIRKLVLPSGEENKKLGTVEKVWQFLSESGAGRKSLLINIGGGMLTDLAGFAASTFKRGIDFLNVPTTLLSQVDASVGGKTGFNFSGFKNEIGTFKEPVMVIINTDFLKTLNRENLLSGFAEMIKHGLIKNEGHLRDLQKFDTDNIDYDELSKLIHDSVEVKKYFVMNDLRESNIRKALNFGHTAGHAFESLAMEQERPVLHGYAVAWGMVVELWLSARFLGLDKNLMKEYSEWLINLYGTFSISDSDYERLYELMTHDKKNVRGKINFTLIPSAGSYEINCDCNKELIYDSLAWFSSL